MGGCSSPPNHVHRSGPQAERGAGVIWNGIPTLVIPARANPIRGRRATNSLRSRFPLSPE
jgi:hypothetical protein